MLRPITLRSILLLLLAGPGLPALASSSASKLRAPGGPAGAQTRPQASATPEVRAILAAQRAGLGTPEALAAPRFLLMHGTLELDGVAGRGRFDEVLAADGRAFVATQLPGMGVHDQGHDGTRYWEEDLRAGARVRDDLSADIARRKYGLLRHARWDELYLGAELEGREEVGGRSCHRLRMIPRLGRADIWYVDAESHRLVRITTQLVGPAGEAVEFVTDLDDWRAVDGVLYPHRRVVLAGEMQLTRRLRSVRHERELPPAFFQAPAAASGAREMPGSLPRLRTLAPQPVASVRLSCKPEEVGARMAEAVRRVAEHLDALGVQAVGPPFTRYHVLGAERVELEAGMPVEGAIEGAGEVRPGELPGGRALTVWHYGPVETIAASYARAEAALQELVHEPASGQWEVYWTPPGRADEELLHRTQLIIPARPRAPSSAASDAPAGAGAEGADDGEER